MARLARVVAVDVAHHVTQRGNARQFILASDSERMVYLDLLRQAVQLHPLSLIGYCLMSNHVHLVVIPRKAEALATALKQAHGRYAAYWNAMHASAVLFLSFGFSAAEFWLSNLHEHCKSHMPLKRIDMMPLPKSLVVSLI